MPDMSIVLYNNKLPISMERVVGLVKLIQKCSKINQKNVFFKNVNPSRYALLDFK